jgi:hypothetical protein
MPTFDEKVERAEELLMRGGTWVRARVEPTASAYNLWKPGNVCLRVTVRTSRGDKEYKSNSQQAKLPNGATLYDGGADGVFDNEVTTASHKLFGYMDADAEANEGFASVDKFVKECKTHRCFLDQEYAFCA